MTIVMAVPQDYNTHIDRILNKFVDLIRGGAEHQYRAIESIPWDEPGPTPSAAAEGLIKNVSSLHKVLAPRLRPAQTQEVFSRVAVTLSELLPTLISRVPIHVLSNTGKERYAESASVCREHAKRSHSSLCCQTFR